MTAVWLLIGLAFLLALTCFLLGFLRGFLLGCGATAGAYNRELEKLRR